MKGAVEISISLSISLSHHKGPLHLLKHLFCSLFAYTSCLPFLRAKHREVCRRLCSHRSRWAYEHLQACLCLGKVANSFTCDSNYLLSMPTQAFHKSYLILENCWRAKDCWTLAASTGPSQALLSFFLVRDCSDRCWGPMSHRSCSLWLSGPEK